MTIAQAHEHADRAELLCLEGDFEGASREHLCAASAYLQAANASEDPLVKRTLQMLHEIQLGSEEQLAIGERTRQQQLQARQEPSANFNADLSASVTAYLPIDHMDGGSYIVLGGNPGEHTKVFDNFFRTFDEMHNGLAMAVAFMAAVDEGGGDEMNACPDDSFVVVSPRDTVSPWMAEALASGSSVKKSGNYKTLNPLAAHLYRIMRTVSTTIMKTRGFASLELARGRTRLELPGSAPPAPFN